MIYIVRRGGFVIWLTIAVLITWNCSQAKIYIKPPYLYHYGGKDPELIDNLDKKLREMVPVMESTLGVRLKDPVRIDVTLTQEQFNRLTKNQVPKWAGGVAYTGATRVVVKAPLFFGQGIPLHILTLHELVHLLVHEAAGDNYIPRWFNEGLAIVLSGELRSGSKRRLNRAAAADGLMGLPRVDHVLTYSTPKADLAYAEAQSAVNRFVDQYGWETVVEILTAVKKGSEFADAFYDAVGMSYEVWQVEWIEYARKKYRWSVLLEMDTLVWMAIFGFGALAVVITFIRRKLQLKQMSDDDEDRDNYSEPIVP